MWWNDEEIERFCNDVNKVLDRTCNRYRFYVIGDPNEWVFEMVMVDITGAFRGTGENNNGKRVELFC